MLKREFGQDEPSIYETMAQSMVDTQLRLARLQADIKERTAKHSVDCYGDGTCMSCECDRLGVVPSACPGHFGSPVHQVVLSERLIKLLETMTKA